MQFIYKAVRATALLLVGATLLELFSGFFATKYFLFSWINYNAIYYVHTVIAPVIFIPVFYLHSFCGILVLMQRNNFLRKRSTKIIISVLWTSVFVFFILFYVVANPFGNTGEKQSLPILENLDGSLTDTPQSLYGSTSLAFTEVSEHDTQEDCWIIINNKVYDVTNYLKYHPGKPETITPYCGKDATNAFQTKNKSKPHSQNATNLLDSFYIGNVKTNTH
jgi:cytochrome b involved in lipid metabolism